MASYHYEPLEDHPRDIFCLLKLLSGHANRDIHANLTNVCLDQKPDDRALSYIGGDATDQKYISPDSRSLLVRGSLWRLLRCLHRDGQTSYLWADAICVNQ